MAWFQYKRQTLEKTDWLLELAASRDIIKGVVGWVPLVSSDVATHLERGEARPKLRGVRHVLQGEPDDFYMLWADFNNGIRALKDHSLVYDILIFERHLPQTTEFVDRHPSQVFLLDHIAKPCIREDILEPWRTYIRELARRENLYCKLSGVVTEADFDSWTPEQVQPYIETVLEAFSTKRVMFGSDWPVCLVASGYSRWVKTVEQFASRLSPTEQQQLFGVTATRAYKLM
jgi:L-fuconolactonase